MSDQGARSNELTPEELGAADGEPLPEREALSVVSDPTGSPILPAEAAAQVDDVPAADPAPVGGRYTIQPVDDQPL